MWISTSVFRLRGSYRMWDQVLYPHLCFTYFWFRSCGFRVFHYDNKIVLSIFLSLNYYFIIYVFLFFYFCYLFLCLFACLFVCLFINSLILSARLSEIENRSPIVDSSRVASIGSTSQAPGRKSRMESLMFRIGFQTSDCLLTTQSEHTFVPLFPGHAWDFPHFPPEWHHPGKRDSILTPVQNTGYEW